MCDALMGTWILTEGNNDDFSKYLEELGVNFVLRKAILALKPDLNISKKGDEWCIKTETKIKTRELSFKLDTEFDESSPDGRNVKTIMTLDNGVLKQLQKVDGKDNVITREVKDGRLVTTMTVGDVKCIRIFDRK
ncbi:fatty acid-binding protein, adipocyte-like [Mixophyes fleayi]|uniref:fatty acid-binding protein, adipocyte-like n=1 Tax=Mixophyes fleayi TaxID=3061075 RepID=UPI003F4DE954